ncbi:MAG: serine/threonine-protein kinase [Planctomycetota bacterium]
METPRDRFEALERLFAQALAIPPAQRDAWVAQATEGRPALRAEIERLLAMDAQDHVSSAITAAGQPPSSLAADPAGSRAPSSRLPEELPRPTAIAGFAIESVLGVGGSGVVYRARQHSPPRAVALKVLRRDAISDESLQRFALEAEVLAYLRHPGIAQIYATGMLDDEEGRRPWFALELVDGLPLHQHCKRGGLGRAAILELFIAICRGVHYAHQRGVVHRDLKPGNVLVDDEGRFKILDFGIARVRGAIGTGPALDTVAGQVLGTLPYASPEQLAGEPSRIDVRTDVYSLGVMLYETLVGRLPLDVRDLSLLQAAEIVREREPPPLSAHDPTYRGDLDTVVKHALAKDPERRYASVAALADDLERFLDHRPITARPTTAFYQLKKFSRRHRTLVAAAGAVAVILVAATVFSVLQAKRAQDRAVLAEELKTFMLDMFVEPNNAGPRTLAADLIEARAAEVDTALPEAGDAKVELLHALGSGLLALGRVERGRGLVMDALALARESGSGTDLLPVMTTATFAAVEASDAEAALTLAAAALPLAEQRNDHITVARLLRARGFALFELGRNEEARRTAQAARLATDASTTAVGARDELVLRSLELRVARSDGSQAPDFLAAVEKNAQGLEDAGLWRAAASSWALAGTHAANDGALEPGAGFFRRALQALDRHSDRAGTTRAHALCSLGVILHKQRRFTAAREKLLEAHEIETEVMAPDHPRSGLTQMGIGNSLVAENKHAEALPWLERAHATLRTSPIVDARRHVVECLDSLAACYHHTGQRDQARVALAELVEQRRAAGPGNETTLARVLTRYADLLLDLDQPDAARPLLVEALALREEHLAPDNWRIASSRGVLGRCLAHCGDFARAEEQLTAAYGVLDRTLPAGHRRRPIAVAHLIELYELWNKPEQAARWRERQ